MSSLDVCRKEGWLRKTGGRVKTWKTRYFRLRTNPAMLEYAPKEAIGTPILGSIPLKGASLSWFGNDVYRKHPIAIGVTPAGQKRTYVMEAATLEDRNSWFTALKEVCGLGKSMDDALSESESAKLSERNSKVGCLKDGELTKLGLDTGNWERRYVVLTGRGLLYFKSKLDANPMHEIDLSRGAVLVTDRESAHPFPFAFSVVPLPPPTVQAERKAHARTGSQVPSGPPRHVFVAATAEERDEWLDEVREVAQAFQTEREREASVAAKKRTSIVI